MQWLQLLSPDVEENGIGLIYPAKHFPRFHRLRVVAVEKAMVGSGHKAQAKERAKLRSRRTLS
jgi:hypothetical protein